MPDSPQEIEDVARVYSDHGAAFVAATAEGSDSVLRAEPLFRDFENEPRTPFEEDQEPTQGDEDEGKPT